ncbi:MAG: ATP synthase F0 subunit B [Acidobacteriaceae bacterium]|nr:ATP synthase F0 subunit B [Acidobacteriaceae bacterium]MBV9295323.1 ATP synthase F0 subunit B [Acidobacteriaceae bacterium]MBV9765751.1 ATP synthase F0 subunit B [Acidobacteriaceae bacterium]
MDETLNALADLLVKALPTIVFFILLTTYLKYVFFKPLGRILDERKQQTEGVRELARRAFDAAEKKHSEFEQALQIARAEIHQEHEALRRKWAQEQVQIVAKARAEADVQIEQAKREISQEAQRAEADLNASVESLSERIVSSLLRRRAA